MRQIKLKKNARLEGNFYGPDQVVGLRRFIVAARERGYTYDELMQAWEEAYGMKCARKRVHFRCIRAASTGYRRGITKVSNLSLAERLKMALSSMAPHDIKLCYCAFLTVAMEVYEIKLGKEVSE